MAEVKMLNIIEAVTERYIQTHDAREALQLCSRILKQRAVMFDFA